jgi:hypothetical protein
MSVKLIGTVPFSVFPLVAPVVGQSAVALSGRIFDPAAFVSSSPLFLRKVKRARRAGFSAALKLAF